jgi:hypothetical protein
MSLYQLDVFIYKESFIDSKVRMKPIQAKDFKPGRCIIKNEDSPCNKNCKFNNKVNHMTKEKKSAWLSTCRLRCLPCHVKNLLDCPLHLGAFRYVRNNNIPMGLFCSCLSKVTWKQVRKWWMREQANHLRDKHGSQRRASYFTKREKHVCGGRTNFLL